MAFGFQSKGAQQKGRSKVLRITLRRSGPLDLHPMVLIKRGEVLAIAHGAKEVVAVGF